MEEVYKGCSEFCVTVGTVTRTASILIHSRLKALAVNLSLPSGRLWLLAGLQPLYIKLVLTPPEKCCRTASNCLGTQWMLVVPF